MYILHKIASGRDTMLLYVTGGDLTFNPWLLILFGIRSDLKSGKSGVGAWRLFFNEMQ